MDKFCGGAPERWRSEWSFRAFLSKQIGEATNEDCKMKIGSLRETSGRKRKVGDRSSEMNLTDALGGHAFKL